MADDKYYAVVVNDILCVESIATDEYWAKSKFISCLNALREREETSFDWEEQVQKGAVVKEITISIV